MQALQINTFGDFDVIDLVELPAPTPSPTQLLVKVEAAGLNYADLLVVQDRYLQTVDLPYVLGREYAGEVVELGSEVTGFEVGERVVGTIASGAFAEYLVVEARAAFKTPPRMTAEQAIALMVQGVTAQHCLHDVGRLQPGESVLVQAASGGVGTLAVQLAALHGATVFGTASTAEKCALIAELGGIPINYREQDFAEVVLQHTDGRGVDLILESVGGEVFLKSYREALATFGRMVVLGSSSQEPARISNAEMIGRGKTLHGYFLMLYYHRDHIQKIADAVHAIGPLIIEGKVRVIIGGTFALDDGRAAFDFMNSRQSTGKIIIRP